MNASLAHIVLCTIIPLITLALLFYVFFHTEKSEMKDKKYRVPFKLKTGKFQIGNVKRGVSIIGSAGSGKTESVIYNFLKHFSKHEFCGIIHDYKDFELTEIAYPLFKDKEVKFYTISFDEIHFKVNPIAPRYLPNEESVNEVSKVLIENLLEQSLSEASGSNKFFSDAVEGLLSGLIWKLKTAHHKYCTLPHLIALFQSMNTKKLVAFLSSDLTSKAMASAFINGIESEKQTAGVKSTLANALKKISSQKLFMILSADEVPLDINNSKSKGVISVVNKPQYESAYSPIIATIMHTVIKQMSVRNQESSFILMEEAPTIKLLNMHRIPATLRSYDITTVYVMQDKIQNDMLYGEKASKAILSNLSYQFFGKVNDPDTAKYYERFFEIVKNPTRSISKGTGLSWDARITKGEKEAPKRRADLFFRLKQGEFIAFADGKDRKIRFKLLNIVKLKPEPRLVFTKEELDLNYQRINRDVKGIADKSVNTSYKGPDRRLL
ncbi:type IV secretory system conjugative DNA transfer family protein [Flagellimonas hymeniacidonis]|uniref:Type IV secretory system conjugative DNA transfer family protein n=1 Tax=Flagellimonas hymeniacidonis TaxID=2603628 RepID=A0A5C8V0N5_9FLAO|nr:type IV secretion system DNA-binding domain-containing protein [Flagellimonas hymeniacidonis]TXN34961.1 type IV secretory system conjugative DNA transfer family protein [Flagellimonas hymeniacidonis]